MFSSQQIKDDLRLRLQQANLAQQLIDEIVQWDDNPQVPARFSDRWSALWTDHLNNNRIQQLAVNPIDDNFRMLRLGALTPEPPQQRFLDVQELVALQGARRLNVGGVNVQPPDIAGPLRLAFPDDVALNTDFLTNPQILGSIAEVVLPLNSTLSAILEGFPAGRITPEVINNLGGAIFPGGGSLEILTGPGAITRASNIVNWMAQAGFQNITMTTPDPFTVQFYGVK